MVFETCRVFWCFPLNNCFLVWMFWVFCDLDVLWCRWKCYKKEGSKMRLQMDIQKTLSWICCQSIYFILKHFEHRVLLFHWILSKYETRYDHLLSLLAVEKTNFKGSPDLPSGLIAVTSTSYSVPGFKSFNVADCPSTVLSLQSSFVLHHCNLYLISLARAFPRLDGASHSSLTCFVSKPSTLLTLLSFGLDGVPLKKKTINDFLSGVVGFSVIYLQ